jgi:hypothetical protein
MCQEYEQATLHTKALSQNRINWWSNFCRYYQWGAGEKLRSLTENFARVEAVWVPNIRWHYEVLLWSSWSDLCELLHFTQLVNVVLQWNFMKSCVPLCHQLKQGQYYYRCVIILYSGTFEMAFVQLVLGYLYNIEILVEGIKVSFLIVKYLCHSFVNTGFKGLCVNIHCFT